MSDVSEDEIISRTHRNAMITLKERLTAARTECAKATKDCDSLKAEVVKAIQGQSSFPMEV